MRVRVNELIGPVKVYTDADPDVPPVWVRITETNVSGFVGRTLTPRAFDDDGVRRAYWELGPPRRWTHAVVVQIEMGPAMLGFRGVPEPGAVVVPEGTVVTRAHFTVIAQ